MRITNKIMQKNNLSNINTNKVLQDKLSTQMSTQKKVNRPSDDPVVAIRALRLRSNVTEATQYYSKNIPDAESWLKVTEGALQNTAAVITDMISQCTKGSNGDLTSSDREIILEQLKALRDEVYSTADVDYAGRYVFAGYRTDTSISFQKAETLKYSITQQLDNTAIDTVIFVKTTATDGKGNVVDINDINTTNFNDITVAEADVTDMEVARIRLSYDKIDEGMIPSITRVTGKDADGNVITEDVVSAANVIKVNAHEVPTAYELASQNPDNVYFIPETGELLLGANVHSKMMAYEDNAATSTVNEAEIRITYEKSEWNAGDLRPEHYYACSTTDAEGTTIDYNQEYLTGSDVEKQVIEYDVGFSQKIRVNTTADEVFDPAIGREVDDIVGVLEDVKGLEGVVSDLKELLEKSTDEAEKAVLESRLSAANKALTLTNNKMQKMFEGTITALQGYLDANSLAITNCGTRSSKLDLIENRMQNQKTTFETLKSENEDIDITEVAIQLNSAELTYEAALLAAGKVLQNSLLNFI